MALIADTLLLLFVLMTIVSLSAQDVPQWRLNQVCHSEAVALLSTHRLFAVGIYQYGLDQGACNVTNSAVNEYEEESTELFTLRRFFKSVSQHETVVFARTSAYTCIAIYQSFLAVVQNIIFVVLYIVK